MANQSQGGAQDDQAPSDHGHGARLCRLISHGLIFIKDSPRALGQKHAMQRIVHTLSCLLLALALVLSGPGSAGPAKGAMLVELCAGDSPSQIWIDADGNPVDPGQTHVKCLDCLLFSAPLADPTLGFMALDPVQADAGLSLPVPSPIPPIVHLRPLPRGPPAAISEDLRHGDQRPDTRSLHFLTLLPLDSCQAATPARVTDPRAIL